MPRQRKKTMKKKVFTSAGRQTTWEQQLSVKWFAMHCHWLNHHRDINLQGCMFFAIKWNLSEIRYYSKLALEVKILMIYDGYEANCLCLMSHFRWCRGNARKLWKKWFSHQEDKRHESNSCLWNGLQCIATDWTITETSICRGLHVFCH